MEWIEIVVKTTTEAVEAVTNILYEVGAAGVVIEDPNDFLFQDKEETTWDYIEEEVYNNGYEGVIIKAYLSEEDKSLLSKIEVVRDRIKLLPSYGLDMGEGTVEVGKVNQSDWENEWKNYYKPVKVGEKIVVKPTWENYDKQEGDLILELDPGMAFGTGTHETTSMCIQALEKYVKSENTTVLDIGCGSGILSIAAGLLGSKNVIGVDLDPVAVKVSKENIELNNLSENIEVRHGNLMDVVSEKAEIVVANIIADIIIFLSKEVGNYLKEDGIFISSGIIHAKLDEVVEAIEEAGFEILEVNKKGEWAAVVSKKK